MRRDWLPPELPQIHRLLRREGPVELEQILANSPLASLGARDLRLERIRYRPGRNCLITWSARLENRVEPYRTFLSLLACRDGESRDHLPATGRSGNDIDGDATHLPELDAVIRIFPADRKLRGIVGLDDPAALVPDLALTVKPLDLGGRLELIQFVAERSVTVRVMLKDAAGWGYGKFYRPGESKVAWEIMTHLWNSEPCRSGRLAIPAPLGHHPASESIWMRGLEGVAIDSGATEEELTEIGRTIAVLHTLPGDGLTEVTARNQREELTRAIETILSVRPDLEERVSRLAPRLESSSGADRVHLHGDLHLKNIFRLVKGAVGLIDLDNAVRGDRWLDLASLAAGLWYQALEMQHDHDRVDDQIAWIMAGYQQSSGQTIDKQHWRRMVACKLLSERAYRCVTRLKPNLSNILERLVLKAERMARA